MAKVTFLCFCFLVVNFQLKADYKFNRIAYIQQGVRGSKAIRAGDSNHNGLNELTFLTYREDLRKNAWEIYEYRPLNTYERVYTDTLNYFIIWDIGDVDRDSLTDLIGATLGNWTPYLVIETFESPDYYSYPTSISWWDKYDSNVVYYSRPAYLTDLDQDNKTDIIFKHADRIYRYENIDDNQNKLVSWEYAPLESWGVTSIAFGDFDLDGSIEFATSVIRWAGYVYVFENIGNDQHKLVFRDSVGLSNGHDVFSGNDTDQDGKPEFFVSFHPHISPSYADFYLFMYEATGDNIYKRVFVDLIPRRYSRNGFFHSISKCGDVDNDGVEEIVWSTGTDVYIYKAVGDDKYERIWHWVNDHGIYPYTATIEIYDLNQNGYKEIIISGENKTSVYEIETPSIPDARSSSGKPLVSWLYQNCPNPFNHKTTIKYQVTGLTDKVSLRIYDVAGRVVKDFTRALSLVPGAYSLVWDGRDDRGRVLPSGIYFCELITQNKAHMNRFTKKLILQR